MIQHRFVVRKGVESGQTVAMVLFMLGIFLLGTIAFSIDYANAYFHRQSAQDAADAACTAGIMNLLTNASEGLSTGGMPCGTCEQGSTPNPLPANYSFLCSANSTAAPCIYAARNGYSANGLTANRPSIEVKVTFPSACASCPTAPPTSLAPYPYLQVNVTDRIPTWFAGMVTGGGTMDVGAKAMCELTQTTAPVPIIVLNPSCEQSFDVSGSATVSIVGGPTRSVQVNSSNPTCSAATQSGNGCSGSGHIDLSHAGPGFNGADFGVVGTPTSAPTNFNGGSAGSWTKAGVIADPFALVQAPGVPTTAGTSSSVAYDPTCANPGGCTGNGCPDHAGCTEYLPGVYTSPIIVKGVTAIFAPGVYYITGTNKDNCGSSSKCDSNPSGQCRYGLDVDSNGVVRPAYDATTGYGSGVMMYFSGASGAGSYGSVFFGGNAGNPGGRTIDSFVNTNFSCPTGTAPDSHLGVPGLVDGNILLGQCTGAGTWVGATTTTGQVDTTGTVRGLIFFQDRKNADTNGQPSMQGGGGLVLSGNLYFHNCHAADSTGTPPCDLPTTGYNAFLQLQGTPGAGTYVLGNITTDSFVLSGNGGVGMALNPNSIYNILKASLVQ